MADLAHVFAQLRSIMLPYGSQLDCTSDTEGNLAFNTKHVQKNKKPLWFGAVQLKKNYVSYHLMPIYVNPNLLEQISPDLKRRMQGKSCFNFTRPDPELIGELARLTEAAFADYRRQGYV